MTTFPVPHRIRFALFALITLVIFSSIIAPKTKAQTNAAPSFSEPAISPDGAEIAFVSGGDIWTVPAAGGEARLLIAHPATESRPLYSPDGRRLAFTSTRTGNGDIYVLTFANGDLQRITFDDANDQLEAWSRDGRWLYFSSTSHDIAGMNDIYRVSSNGGTPMPVSADVYVNEFFAAPSPDGSMLALNARGIASAQWWRKGHSHLDESEIWIRRENANGTPNYERLTDGDAKELWAMWSGDGRSIFYVSDRSGAQNIWTRALDKSPARQITNFKDGRVLFPNISNDGRTIVFERNFRIWKLDTASGEAREVPITLRGAPATPLVEHLRLTDQISEIHLSPDGKKIAFVVRGEIFAASATDGGDAARVTFSPADESQIAWSPDSRRIVYVSDRDGASHIFTFDFATNAETKLTDTNLSDALPRFSSDGKMLAFIRDARELRVLNLETKQERVLTNGNFGRPPLDSDRSFVWSPDNRWLAYLTRSERQFTNVYVVPVTGANNAQPVSFVANSFSNTISWSPDGTYILFDTGQRTEEAQLARIDLIPRTPKFREDQFRDLFREEVPKPNTPVERTQQLPVAPPPTPSPTPTPTQTPAPNELPAPNETPTPTQTSAPSPSDLLRTTDARKPAPQPVKIVFEQIRRRLNFLPVGVNVNYQTISPDGKWVAMIARVAGQSNIYVYSLDELAREPVVARQLTSTPGFKTNAQFSPDSKEIYYLEQGHIQIVPLDARQPARPLAVAAEMDVDFARDKMEVFQEAWSYLRDHFADPNMNGVDWTRAHAAYQPLISAARTPDEMRRIINLMIGELNASHSGIAAPLSATTLTTGRIGLRFDRIEYERNGRLRVTEVIPLAPAALSGQIKIGDYLLAVDGKTIDARTNLDELLNYKINRRVSLIIADSVDGKNRREVIVRPVNRDTEKNLIYRQWVENERAYVAKISNGRLGYVHLYDMSAAALTQFYADLDAENQSREGVIVDVRNNNGGFVNVYAIDVLARRSYLTMQPRGFSTPAPARSVLGQRTLELPTILVTNQHSLSDAEDFTEGYRSEHLGKTVGEPTAGWIIYTSNVPLIDGSVLRLPHTTVRGSDGRIMEMNPRPVDIPVSKPLGESYAGRDSQLERAAQELLAEINQPKR